MEPLTTLTVTVVGVLVGYLTGYTRKKGENLATHEDIDKLVTQVSKVTEATKLIEARIDRSSRVYERQLLILQKLYHHMVDVQGLLMRMTSAGRFAGELEPEGYSAMVVDALTLVRDDFLNGKLFMPPELVKQCDSFFEVVFDGQRNFAMAQLPALDPNHRAEYSHKAGTLAHQKVPQVLEEIEKAARVLIHGR